MVKLDFRAEKIGNEGKKEFQGYESGEHLVQIQAIESGVAKQSSREYWQFTLVGDTLAKGRTKGRYNFRIYDTAYGRSDLYDLFVALGIDPERDDVDTEELEGSWFKIELQEGEPYNDKPQWNVVEIFSADTDDEDSDDEDDDFDDF